jgi:hypothetical protein
MNYRILEDGSILFDAPFIFVTNSYSQDPDDPRHYIPKYDSCRHRRFELKTMSCGRQACLWKCDLFNRSTSVPECRACNEKS